VTESLLVNFVYAPPVGHAIEALHYCNGYHRADPAKRIAVALNAATPTELAGLCPFIDATYPIRGLDLIDGTQDVMPAIAGIPREWDWIVEDGRGRLPDQRDLFPGLARYYDESRTYFVAWDFGAAGAAPPDYRPREPFRLQLPDLPTPVGDRRPRIAVLPAGGGERELYPSIASWELVLRVLALRFPDATFCLVGKRSRDGRTHTAFRDAEFERLRQTVPRCVAAIDVPLIDQLAAVRACDVFISPHSGFGMAALATGTPWLAISGNKWPEYYFNGVPFYSVLPDIARFPCYTYLAPDPPLVDDDGPRSPSMSATRIRADLDEIVEAAAGLIEQRWDYDTALAGHVARALRLYDGDIGRMWSVDGVLARVAARLRVD